MAGTASMLNPTHAALRGAAEGRAYRFPQRAMVEATVTMLGRTFRTTIHEGATTNELIEKVARENNGEVTKRYYSEFQTWEITGVRIGDAALVKSTESGIHWSLGSHGIPIAIMPGSAGVGTDPQVVFPNGDELRIGRETSNISLWTTSAPFDPQSIRDLDGMYSAKGGVALSNGALEELSRAHGGGRSGKMALEINNILVLNRDTGEILSVSEHASKEPAPVVIMPDQVSVSLPASASCSPAPLGAQEFIPARFDGFRERLDLGRMIVRTFDGSVADMVRIQVNPFSQDKLDAGFARMPKAQTMIPAPEFGAPPTDANAPAVAFSLLVFTKGHGKSAPDDPPPGPPPSPFAPRIRNPEGRLMFGINESGSVPAQSGSAARPLTNALKSAVPPITPEAAARAWREPRSEPVALGIPAGAVDIETPKRQKQGKKHDSGRNALPAGTARRILACAGVLIAVIRIMKAQARKAEEALRARRRGLAPALRAVHDVSSTANAMRKQISSAPKADAASTAQLEKKKGRRMKDGRAGRARTQARIDEKPSASISTASKAAPIHASDRKASMRKAARRGPGKLRNPPKPISGRRKAPPSVPVRRGKKARSGRYINDLLGVFRRKRARKRITGRAWAGN